MNIILIRVKMIFIFTECLAKSSFGKYLCLNGKKRMLELYFTDNI